MRPREGHSTGWRLVMDEALFELDTQASKKNSLETRALGVFALNLGVATLYLAIREHVAFATAVPGDFSFVLLIIAFAFMVLSVVLAIAVAFPARYPGLNVLRLGDELMQTKPLSSAELLEAIARARIGLLIKSKKSNHWKSVLMMGALTLAGLAIVLLAGVMLFT